MEWGMDRVGRAERGVSDPDYTRWLAEAETRDARAVTGAL